MSLHESIVAGDRSYATKDFVAALNNFRVGTVFRPSDLGLLLRVAVVLADLGDLEASGRFLHWAARLDPCSADTHFNLASLRLRQHRPDLASVSATKTLVVDPARWGAYTNRALADQALSMPESALRFYERSLRLSSGANNRTRVNLGQLLLSMGRFAEGWAHFAQRFEVDTPQLKTNLPRFDGNRRGKVLLWGDQGVGDQVMFSSMLNDWIKTGVPCTLRVDDRLVSLFLRSFPEMETIGESSGINQDAYSSQLSLGDLGLFLRSSALDFKGRGGAFLYPDHDSVRSAARRLRADHQGLVIGISWRSHNADTGMMRSLTLQKLCDSIALPGVRLVNLQYGDTYGEVRAANDRGLSAGSVCDSGVNNTNDLDGLAAVISACDLVVTIGNTTAHLAAALGKVAWVLVPQVSGWRWMQSGSRTPWYDSVEVIRQTLPGDWTHPLSIVRNRLIDKLGLLRDS